MLYHIAFIVESIVIGLHSTAIHQHLVGMSPSHVGRSESADVVGVVLRYDEVLLCQVLLCNHQVLRYKLTAPF
jgi:hypothetical protein